MEKKVSELLDTMAPPIVNPCLQVFHSFVEEITIDSLVSLGQDSLSRFFTKSKVLLRSFIFRLLAQVLQ